jgi:glyoxylase-like metal-dependent hydrolase (beta-lactamase superfamily II)
LRALSPAAASAALPPYAQALGHGVHAIDTGFERDRFDAAYLLVEGDRAAFIDSGTHFAVPRLLGTLAALGLDTSAVEWVVPTHVHLDHAGGAGLLMSHLPRARMLVHPRGVRHMLDPSALWQGATAVYGAEVMARSYGSVVAVPADRVVASADGMTIELGGRPLKVADTPGHARHHHCLWDEASHGWFTGDTFGLSYREFDTARGAWIMPSATPVQFEPDVLRASVTRLLESDPACMYLTHFGRVDDVPRLGVQFLGLLAGLVALGRAQRPSAGRHAALVEGQLELFGRSLAEHGCTQSRDELAQLLAVDLELNAQGMGLWLDRG